MDVIPTPGLEAVFRDKATKKLEAHPIVGTSGSAYLLTYMGKIHVVDELKNFRQRLILKRIRWNPMTVKVDQGGEVKDG